MAAIFAKKVMLNIDKFRQIPESLFNYLTSLIKLIIQYKTYLVKIHKSFCNSGC